MPPLFQPVKITQSTLESTAIVDGKVYFAQDSERLFFDYDGVRTELRDIIILDTEGERSELLAPKNKFYFVLETSILWLYKAGQWYEISGGSSGSVNFASKTFSAGESVESVVLDEEVAGAGSIVSVNVDNTVLLKSAYTLNPDNKTIQFSEPVACEIGIEVLYIKKEQATLEMNALNVANAPVTQLVTTASRSTMSTVEKDITLTANCFYKLALTGHTNISFGNWTSDQENKITLYLTIPDAYTLTLPASVKWKNGNAPNLEIDGHYIFEFRSIDGGNTVYGSVDKYI